MRGQMMTEPLLISALVEHAARYHGQTQITSINTGGGVEVTNWGSVRDNGLLLASALAGLGLEPQARCATIAWNNRRHLEIYFGVSGGGFVCHTINPRLFPDQLVYIINHAQDEVLFIDQTFVPLVASIRDRLETVAHIVLLEPETGGAADALPGIISYDDLLTSGDPEYEWPKLDEFTASSLCYTSGTTGNPKGVLFSHRSTVLHSFTANLTDVAGFSALDVVLPVVPMFHVNAWGSPYACAMVGASLVLPGPGLDGASLVARIDRYRVTVALGVPTIWIGLLKEAGGVGSKLESLKRTIVGGSACPPSMITGFRERFGVETIHAWGMTEMSPIGTVNRPLARHADLPPEEQLRLRENQGRAVYGVEMKLVDDSGARLPEDGKTQGQLLVRGPHILNAYFQMSEEDTLQDGWFNTGDVATIDAEGYLTIVDRAKDIIKSGGEWISSVELESIAIAHPDLADAAVIGVPHPKWDERPVVVAVPVAGKTPTQEEILEIFDDRIASWQRPDAVIFKESLPRNATGKVLKKDLREEFARLLTP